MVLALLTVIALHASTSERIYRVGVPGTPGRLMTVSARAPDGWLPAFCSATLCARNHISQRIPSSGVLHLSLHVYRISNHPDSGLVRIQDAAGHAAQFSLKDRTLATKGNPRKK